jgi:hypothetical protein
MTIYFAKSTNGFYDSSININIPKDAKEITFSIWESLLTGQSRGQQITSDESGNPILVNLTQATLIPLTTQQKLNNLGLSVDDLKILLGL